MPIIGRSVRRSEDHRFLTGRGRYVEDAAEPGAAHAYVLRSPHAHAAILRIDAGAALAMPGVLAVFTEADLAAEGIGRSALRGAGGEPRTADRPVAAGAGEGPGAPCRRSGGVCRGADPRFGARRR